MLRSPLRTLHPLLLASVLPWSVGCDGGGDGDGDACADADGPSFETTVRPLIDATCVEGCHTSDPGAIGSTFDLSSDPYEVMVGKPSLQLDTMNFVEPCSADDSYVWHKVAGTQADVGGGGTKQMPLDDTTCDSQNYLDPECTSAPLTAAEQQIIREWIDGGAKP